MSTQPTPANSAILPTETCGDSSEDAIWTSVGRALSKWEDLQNGLAHLFNAACHADDFSAYPLLRAFGFNMQVIQKLDMIEYAAEASIGMMGEEDLHKRVGALLKKIKGYNERRNDIAHGTVMRLYRDKSSVGFYLAPRMHISKKYKEHFADAPLVPLYSWTSSQINRYTEAFIVLLQEAQALTQEIKQLAERERGSLPDASA